MEVKLSTSVKQAHLEIYDVKRVCADLLQAQHQFSDFRSKTNFTIATNQLEFLSSDESSIMGDGSISTNPDYQVSRESKLATFKKTKASIEPQESALLNMVARASEIIEIFSGIPMWLEHLKPLVLITADENTLLSNKDWIDNMQHAYDNLNFYLEEIEVVVDYLERRLALYEAGDSSVLIPEKAVYRPRPEK